MSRKRSRSFSTSVARTGSGHVFRTDRAYSIVSVTTSSKSQILYTAPVGFSGVLSIKKLLIYMRYATVSPSVAQPGVTKFAVVLALNRDNSLQGTISIPGADANTELYNQQNNVLWSEFGMIVPTNTGYWDGTDVNQERFNAYPVRVDIDFKKLKRKVKPGDYLYIKVVTDGGSVGTDTVNFGGVCTFYIKD